MEKTSGGGLLQRGPRKGKKTQRLAFCPASGIARSPWDARLVLGLSEKDARLSGAVAEVCLRVIACKRAGASSQRCDHAHRTSWRDYCNIDQKTRGGGDALRAERDPTGLKALLKSRLGRGKTISTEIFTRKRRERPDFCAIWRIARASGGESYSLWLCLLAAGFATAAQELGEIGDEVPSGLNPKGGRQL